MVWTKIISKDFWVLVLVKVGPLLAYSSPTQCMFLHTLMN